MLRSLLINRIPDLHCKNFDFVKVKGRKVTTPVFKKGQDIGYKQPKALPGQGAVYVWLKNKLVLSETNTASHSEEVVEITDGNSTPLDVVTTNMSSTQGPQPSCGSVSVTTSSQQPGSSIMCSYSAQLKQIFSHHRVFYWKFIWSMMPYQRSYQVRMMQVLILLLDPFIWSSHPRCFFFVEVLLFH